jgi:hypothetical protein
LIHQSKAAIEVLSRWRTIKEFTGALAAATEPLQLVYHLPGLCMALAAAVA